MDTRITELREAQHLTRKQLAERAGVSYTALTKWELGKNEIGLAQAAAVAKALGVKISDLVYTRPQHDHQLDRICRNYRDMTDDGKRALAAASDALLTTFKSDLGGGDSMGSAGKASGNEGAAPSDDARSPKGGAEENAHEAVRGHEGDDGKQDV